MADFVAVASDEGIFSPRKRKATEISTNAEPHGDDFRHDCGKWDNSMPPPTLPASTSSPRRTHPAGSQVPQIRIQNSLPLVGASTRQSTIYDPDARLGHAPVVSDHVYGISERAGVQDDLMMSGALPTSVPDYGASRYFNARPGSAAHAGSFTPYTRAGSVAPPWPHSSGERLNQSRAGIAAQAVDQCQPMRPYRISSPSVPLRRQRTPFMVPWQGQPTYRTSDQTPCQPTPQRRPDIRASNGVNPSQQCFAKPYTPSPQRSTISGSFTDPPVASPFFRSGSSVGCSGARGNFLAQPVPQHRKMQILQEDYEVQSAQRTPSRAFPVQSHSINGLSFIDQPYSVGNHEPLYGRPSSSICNVRLSTSSPRVTRDARGFFARPDSGRGPRAPSSHLSRQPQTLPSNQPTLVPEMMPTRSQHRSARNESLSVVKGAKGAGTVSGRSSLQNGYNAASRGNIYGTSRRAVRR